MSVERQYGKVTLICDECGDEYDWYKSADFSDLKNDAMVDGWHIEKNGEEWEHTCSHCLKHAPKFTVT